MEIVLDRRSATPLYLQISRRITALIHDGALPAGFRLPPERRLAAALSVNRSTVLAAYRELKADGLVDAHVGQGTTVQPRRFEPQELGSVQSFPWSQALARAPQPQDPLVRDLLELTERDGGISLGVGLPAPETLPVDTLRAITDRLLGEVGAPLLMHSPTEGHSPLRETIAAVLAARGIVCSPAEVLVVTGSQQGLDLVARVLLSPGDEVLVEAPSYFGGMQTFRAAGARLLSVPTDHEGMRPDALAALLERHRPKLIYTLPTFQNPSGVVLSLERRHRLLELAARFSVPLLEDDPYAELRYDGTSLPTLAALDRHGHVLYLSTFSKLLAPGLRVGFVVAPRLVVRRLVLAKQIVDLHTNTLAQVVIDRFIRDGHYGPHLERARAVYAARRDAMHEALQAATALGVTWRKPEGGFYHWCRLPDGVDQSRLLARAAAAGVSYLPGQPCFAEEGGAAFARLAFSYAPAAQLREGISRFLTALREVAAEPAAAERDRNGTRPLV